MKNKFFVWSFTVALSGFLFGFDTAVISGADQPIQELWGLSDLFHGFLIMSMALWGTVIGALFGGIPCDRYGRKKILSVSLIVTILFYIVITYSLEIKNLWLLMAGCFLAGLSES